MFTPQPAPVTDTLNAIAHTLVRAAACELPGWVLHCFTRDAARAVTLVQNRNCAACLKNTLTPANTPKDQAGRTSPCVYVRYDNLSSCYHIVLLQLGPYLLQPTGGGFLPGNYSWFLLGWRSRSAMIAALLPWERGGIAAAPLYT